MDDPFDSDRIEAYGTLLTASAVLDDLPRAYGRDQEVSMIVDRLVNGDKKALLLTGQAGVGKTAIVFEIAHRLAELDWQLLEVKPSDFMAGTKYLGEWETRVTKLLSLVKKPARIVLYLPEFDELSMVGRSSSSTSNVADVLTPLLTRGELAVLGEAPADATNLQSPIRRTMERITINPLSRDITLELIERVARSERVTLEPGLPERILELADYCGLQVELPGRGLNLLRRSLNHREETAPLSEGELLRAVTETTGVPTNMLDDRVALQRSAVRDFFESRVMGQREAVDAAVDLVMMIKAGLTDPNKPFNTMLFVGPTGVGKTELARSVAEYCMGDANRLVRIDMSEYSTREAAFRLLGSAEHPGSLTGPIRERPFSIILLDEFEKANYAVFDLCLQLFDAGRLTDLNNRTVDFCRTVIILTSNLGSQVASGPGMGFGPSGHADESAYAKTKRKAERELERVFRPEFLNRLDRIVHFAPLERETLEQIARRELERSLDRGGIHRRRLNVQLDPAVLPVLLEKGYSPAFGARPLKRTIERSILVPLARQIATGKLPPGSTVLLGLKGGKIRPKVLDLGELPEAMKNATPTRISQPPTTVDQIQRLLESVSALSLKMRRLAYLKTTLLEQVNSQSLPDKMDRTTALDQLYRWDSILERYERFATLLQPFKESPRSDRETVHPTAEFLSGLELEARVLSSSTHSDDARYMADVVVTVQLIESRGGALSVVEKLARMYQNFLTRLHFEIEVLDDQYQTKPLVDQISFMVTGPGAWLVLRQEQGLHVFRRMSLDGRSRNKTANHHGRGRTDQATKSRGKDLSRDKQVPDEGQREIAKVEILPLIGNGEESVLQECVTDYRRLPTSKGRLVERRLEASFYHPPSQVSLSAILDSTPAEATSLLGPWLAGLVARQQALKDSKQLTTFSNIVRRYDLGANSLIRDVGSGQRWGHADLLLSGWLDRFVPDWTEQDGQSLA